jgi:hypothetical protein
VIPTLKNAINPETPRKKPRTFIPPPQASVRKRSRLEAFFGTLPEGETITEGHLDVAPRLRETGTPRIPAQRSCLLEYGTAWHRTNQLFITNNINARV